MQETMHEEAFIESFHQYGDGIFRFCLVKVSDRAVAEDMTQEVFMRYWQYLRDGNEMTNTRSLLFTIANNLAKDWYKKKKSTSLDAQMEDGVVPTDDRTADPETAAAYREVLKTMEDLSEDDRDVLVLRHVEGLDPKDIAAILGESANTISVRLNRATKRLRHILES